MVIYGYLAVKFSYSLLFGGVRWGRRGLLGGGEGVLGGLHGLVRAVSHQTLYKSTLQAPLLFPLWKKKANTHFSMKFDVVNSSPKLNIWQTRKMDHSFLD